MEKKVKKLFFQLKKRLQRLNYYKKDTQIKKKKTNYKFIQ